MTRIRVSTVIDAPPRVVWAAIDDIATHVDWMADAVAIRFISGQRSGVGARFECDSAVGPFRLMDVMEVTEWKPGRRMGIRHEGTVVGVGAFTLKARRRGRTRFTWNEKLHFPLWMGGPIGGWFGAIALELIWRGNLRRLKARIED